MLLYGGDNVHFQKLYITKECSGMEVVIPGPRTLYAHREVLIAGSKILEEYFELNPWINGYRMTLHAGADSYEFAFKYMYGFPLAEINCLPTPRTFRGLVDVVAIAKYLDIPGLFSLACLTAREALIECLNSRNEAKLQDFFSVTTWKHSLTDRLFSTLGCKIFAENITKLNKTATFREMTRMRPKLAVMILLAVR